MSWLFFMMIGITIIPFRTFQPVSFEMEMLMDTITFCTALIIIAIAKHNE